MEIQESVETAYEHMENKKFTLAVIHLETAIQSQEFNTSDMKHLIYHSLGVCYLELKAFDDAISAFQASLNFAPKPIETADYVTLSDTHHFISRAYEEKSAFGRNLLPFVGGNLVCH
ncbi:tetratricopeptide repeat protein [Tumebacillus permanentifrigoris]|uniref:Uncharacterized protein n=1 Tax=Tumebacillus permanentifrigoris TaxID=378543 RepID=A0A316D5Y4_9BACL|nr:tetratricopeptide repeat protein [Tumebacillus permanentifrigoris]PWK08473.1 hypothetical protein C7459_115133 [Tumebacillus permanentifrigoris]